MHLLSGMPGKDGTECPVSCPMKCGPEEMQCWGGYDDNGCIMPDACVPMTETCPTMA